MSNIDSKTEPMQIAQRVPIIVRAPEPPFGDFDEGFAWAFRTGLFICAIQGIAFILPRIMPVTSALPLPMRGLLVMIPTGVVLMLVLRRSGGPAIARIQKAARVARGKDSHAFIAAVAKAVPFNPCDDRVYRQLAGELHGAGYTRDIIFLVSRFSPPIIPDPLRVSFGPVSLDETDHIFRALATGSPVQTGSDSENLASSKRRNPLGRQVRWTYPGGIGLPITMIILCAILLAISIWFFSQPFFSSVTVLMVLTCLIALPLFRRDLTSHTWYLVSGGLAMREPEQKHEASRVTLFRQTDSVLVLKERDGRSWLMIVSDGVNSGLHLVSEAEASLLLRAWLSPIPPPTVEKLIDLT